MGYQSTYRRRVSPRIVSFRVRRTPDAGLDRNSRAASHTFALPCAIARAHGRALQGLDFLLTVPLTQV